MSSLINFEKVATSYKIVEPVLSSYLSKAEIESFSSQLTERLENQKPRIMVYGVYNAGKSTLLNALIGREEAKMSDRPETSTITSYQWNGYTLLDTPGIDAPEADERIARTEIDRSDVILFVVAFGGAIEESTTWEELVDILKRGRKVLIILNNKNALDPESESYQKIAEKFRSNLQYIAKEKGLSNLELPMICLVDAKTALLGKIENEEDLIEISGILSLERSLGDFLQSCDSYTVLNTARRDLITQIEHTEIALQNKKGDYLTKELTSLRQDIDHEKASLANTMNDELDSNLSKAKVRIITTIKSIAETEKNQQLAQTKMQDEASEISTWVGTKLNQSLSFLLPETQKKLNKFGASLQEGELGTTDQNFYSNISNDPSGDINSFTLSQTAKDAISKIPVADLTTKATLAALEFGKKTFPTLFEGIGKKTMGKWAGVAGKWAGPIVQVGTMLHSLYQAEKEAEAERMAKERMYKAIQDAATDFTGELRLVYRQQIQEVIKTMFQPLNDWLENVEKSHLQKNETAKRELDLLKRIKLDLQQMS